jgi:hypothetical protein
MKRLLYLIVLCFFVPISASGGVYYDYLNQRLSIFPSISSTGITDLDDLPGDTEDNDKIDPWLVHNISTQGHGHTEYVPATRTVAGHALSSDVAISADDVSLGTTDAPQFARMGLGMAADAAKPLVSTGFSVDASGNVVCVKITTTGDGPALKAPSGTWPVSPEAGDLGSSTGDELYYQPKTGSAVDLLARGMLNSSDDPDVATPGRMSFDIDGWLRVFADSVQKGIPINDTIHATIFKPNDLADASRDACQIWENTSGMSFVITGWSASSSTDDTTLNIEETDGDGQNNYTVDAVEIATNGTGIYTASDTTISLPIIENGHRLWLDFDDTDDPGWVKITIYGYYLGDVD